MSKIICVASGKGGVGKTTSVINIGSALNKFGYDTIIVDGNINTPDIGLVLGMPANGTNLSDVLLNKKTIYETVYLHPNGTKVVPAGLNMWQLKDMNMEKLNEIKKLKNYCDIILLDCAPGINDDVEKCIKISDGVLIVTNPEIHSVTDALKTVFLAKKYNKPVIGAVINKFEGKEYEMSAENIEQFLGVPVISVIPFDNKVKKALSERKTIVDAYPFSKASIGFKKAAAKIIGQDYIVKEGLLQRIFNFFKRK